MKRISALFQQELARIVARELKDPVFEGKVISFPEIAVTRDLSTAQVMVSVLGDGSATADVVRALNAAEPLIRHKIMKVANLRKVPVFEFLEDRTIETASKIEGILNMLDIPLEEPENNDKS